MKKRKKENKNNIFLNIWNNFATIFDHRLDLIKVDN